MREPVNRRDVLKKLGASALAGAALVRLGEEASADEPAKPTEERKAAAQKPMRKPLLIHGGSGRGAIKALISTQALRDRLKPFVFLDHFDVRSSRPWGFAFHPHSGVATFTYPWSADLEHKDTGGNRGRLARNGVQWMASGGGIWHEEYYQPTNGRVEGLQLWVVLPPEMENGPVGYQAAAPSELPQSGDTKVLAGTFQGKRSPIRTPYPFNYFDVKLDSGKTWRFTPPEGHDVAWTYNHTGNGTFCGKSVRDRQLVVFSEADGEIVVSAGKHPLQFAFASAKRTPWPVVVERGSMHTSRDALKRGFARIREIGTKLKRGG